MKDDCVERQIYKSRLGEIKICLQMFPKILLSVGIVFTAHAESADPLSPSDTSPSVDSSVAGAMPSTVLIAKPEGTPLPPRDSRVADHWPPEFKQMIDKMLNLFPENGELIDSADVARKMGLTLTERPNSSAVSYFTSKRYAVTGTRYMAPDLKVDPSSDLRENYYITPRRSTERHGTQTLTLVIAPAQSGFCLNPYEFAVYTGRSFVNGDTTAHANIRLWAPVAVWGMFNWSATGRYASQNIRLVVDILTNPDTKQITGVGCVQTLTVIGDFKE